MFNTFAALVNAPHILSTNPTSTADFSCFAVNVTGAGIAPDSTQLQGCTSSTNMHGTGVGLVSQTVPRGTPIALTVPSGPARSIDVYGVFPPDQSCTGTSNSGGGGGAGYFLGRNVTDLGADTTVTVGIGYGGANPEVVCTGGSGGSGGSGGGFFINEPSPKAGCQSSSYTMVLSGGGFLSGATVTIGGATCTSPVVVSPNQINCSVPSGLPANSNTNITVTNPGGATSSINFFQVIASGQPHLSTDVNPGNMDFGSAVASSGHNDLTINYTSDGCVTANEISGSTPTGIPAPFSFITGGTCALSSATLPVNTSCSVILRFAPTSTGAASGTLLHNTFFTGGDPDIQMNGTGT
ncbi:MAG: IPT/TIG domain-containing protein [Deltaproteobacteria bacterium]|nr:IPT/TIG domain-containing protein [Deltaproteobacteria bacterium]